MFNRKSKEKEWTVFLVEPNMNCQFWKKHCTPGEVRYAAWGRRTFPYHTQPIFSIGCEPPMILSIQNAEKNNKYTKRKKKKSFQVFDALPIFRVGCGKLKISTGCKKSGIPMEIAHRWLIYQLDPYKNNFKATKEAHPRVNFTSDQPWLTVPAR